MTEMNDVNEIKNCIDTGLRKMTLPPDFATRITAPGTMPSLCTGCAAPPPLSCVSHCWAQRHSRQDPCSTPGSA